MKVLFYLIILFIGGSTVSAQNYFSFIKCSNLYNNDKYKEANKCFLEKVDANKKNGEFWLLYGYSLLSDEQWKESSEALKKAVKFTNDIEVMYSANLGLGNIQFNLNSLDSAKLFYNKAKENCSNKSEIYACLAEVSLYEELYEQSIEYLDIAISLDSLNSQAVLLKAEVLIEQNKNSEAILILNKFNFYECFDEEKIYSEYLIGVAYFQNNNFEKSLIFLDKVLKVSMNNDIEDFIDMYDLHFCLGGIYFYLKDYTSSLDSYFSAKQYYSDDYIYYCIGLTYLELKDYSKAIEMMDLANDLNKENTDVLLSLAYIHTCINQLTVSNSYLQLANEKLPKDFFYSIFIESLIEYKKGNFSEAILLAKKAVDIGSEQDFFSIKGEVFFIIADMNLQDKGLDDVACQLIKKAQFYGSELNEKLNVQKCN